MYRTEHQVAGQGGVNGDVGRLSVPYLAHHYHVRVLAQDGAQTSREGDIGGEIDLALVDIRQLVLDRILNSDNIAAFSVDAVESSIERGGLARPSGPR